MCGRYVLYALPREIQAHFGLSAPVRYHPSYNIAPTQNIVGVCQPFGGERSAAEYRWGLIPHWAKEIGRYSTINARAESVATKPAYRGPFRRHRLLIPASGYYEWQERAAGGKQPYYIHAKDGGLVAFAGLWDRWEPQSGKGSVIVSAAIIVTEANRDTRRIHDRMPVILPPDAWDAWLNPDNQDATALAALLVPAASGTLEAHPVGRAVNSPRNNRPELISEQR